MYTTYHFKTAAEVNSDILDSIKTAFRGKSIVITVEEETDDADETTEWNDLTEMQKASIERGLKDMKEGNTIPHEEMVKYYSKWLTK